MGVTSKSGSSEDKGELREDATVKDANDMDQGKTEALSCRICFASEDVLMSDVCKCKGTLNSVHGRYGLQIVLPAVLLSPPHPHPYCRCLVRWQLRRPSNPWNCEICQSTIMWPPSETLTLVELLAEEQQHQRKLTASTTTTVTTNDRDASTRAQPTTTTSPPPSLPPPQQERRQRRQQLRPSLILQCRRAITQSYKSLIQKATCTSAANALDTSPPSHRHRHTGNSMTTNT